MPRVLTDAYREKTFFIALTADKSEGVWVKPLSETDRNELRRNTLKEAGGDADVATALLSCAYLQNAVVDWKGFTDARGNDLPCSAEIIKEVCRCDPDFTTGLLLRISNVARYGMLDDEKN